MIKYKTPLILEIGRIVRKSNPKAVFSDEEILALRRKSVKQLSNFIEELKVS